MFARGRNINETWRTIEAWRGLRIEPQLRDLFKAVYEIEKPGHIEGGDILVTGKEILVGRSARTDEKVLGSFQK